MSVPRHAIESARLPRPVMVSRRICLTPKTPSYPRSRDRSRHVGRAPCRCLGDRRCLGEVAETVTPTLPAAASSCPCTVAFQRSAGRARCRPGLRRRRAHGRYHRDVRCLGRLDRVQQRPPGPHRRAVPGLGVAAIGALVASVTVANWTAAPRPPPDHRLAPGLGRRLSRALPRTSRLHASGAASLYVRQTRRLGGVVRDRCAGSVDGPVAMLEFAHACKYATSGVGGRRRHSCCRGAADAG